APTTLPALVPDTTTGSRPLASSILITPMWAKPLAAPPPRATPMRILGTVTGATAAFTGGGSGRVLPPQAVRIIPAQRSVQERCRKRLVVRMATGRCDRVGH